LDFVNGPNFTGLTNPNYGTMRVWQNVVNSNYHGLQVSLKKAMSHGIATTVNYTWSHSIDGGSGWHNSATGANGAAGGDGYNTDLEVPAVDRGNSIFDVRHVLTANYIWDLPTLKGASPLVRQLFGGWSYNGIIKYQSGAHWSPYQSRGIRPGIDPVTLCTQATINAGTCLNERGDYNLDGIANDRPNSNVANFNPSSAEWADGWGGAMQTAGSVANQIFSHPCLGCVGNLGRNTFVGPSFIGADMSLFKNVNLGERMKMQFRWEVFNVFNHTNFMLPGGNFAANNRVDRADFGQSGGTFNPRQMQLGLKISF
jgi:hypothetical protein